MPSPITVSANLIDLTGNAIQGYIKAAIVSPTGIYDLYVSGTGIIVPKISTSTTSSNPSVQIWGTDVVVDLADNTADTYYDVSIYDATNNLMFRASYYFTGAGPINLVGFAPIAFLPPPPAFSAPPVSQLPGGANGNVQFNNSGVFGGDSTFTFTSATKVVGGTIFNAGTGFQIGGAATSGQFLRGNGTNFVASTIQSGDVLWNQLGNASSALTLANGTNATTFNQTSNVAWTWANTAAASSGANAPAPFLTLQGNIWNGSSSLDGWSLESVIPASGNNASTLTFVHVGSASASIGVSLPNTLTVTNTGGVSGTVVLQGSSSGQAGWTVGGVAGSPHLTAMPGADPTATGALLSATVGNPTATSWTVTPLVSTFTLTGATPTGSAGQVSFGTTTANSATAGANGDVPAQVAAYLEIDIAGTKFKVPYYNV